MNKGGMLPKLQAQVAMFNDKFDLELAASPRIGHDELNEFRIRLLKEELRELIAALLNNDVYEMADALADILYVTYGAAVSYGFNMDPICDEVHKSNMTKLHDGVVVKDEGGKVIKPESYEPPDIVSVVNFLAGMGNQNRPIMKIKNERPYKPEDINLEDERYFTDG